MRLSRKSNLFLNTVTLVVAIFGAVGFIIWALALIFKGSSSVWAWMGGILVGILSILLTALARWFK